MKTYVQPIIVCLFVVTLLGGCRKAVPVQEGKLPEHVIGHWKAEEGPGEFVFDSNGLVAFENFLGHHIEAEEGGSYEEGKENQFIMSTLGSVDTVYDSNSRELKVTVVTDYFRMEILDGLIEGKSEDEYVGRIAADGRTWTLTWVNKITMLDIDPDKETVSTRELTLTKIK